MNSRRRRLCTAFTIVALSNSAVAYGPRGHEIVGGVADELIAATPAAEKIARLIDGMTLERASTIADEIKGWDKKGVDDQKSFHYSAYRNLDRQLRDFWRANAPAPSASSSAPSHHWFHYTDVPVTPAQKYHDGPAGRNNWDIVHMIPYCIEVLEGRLPENNERKITKPIAVICWPITWLTYTSHCTWEPNILISRGGLRILRRINRRSPMKAEIHLHLN